MKIENQINNITETPKEEPLVAIYNNSNEIFGISNKRILKPKGNARVSASEAAMLIKNHKHAIHLQMIDESKTISDFAAKENSLKEEIEALKAENKKLKTEESETKSKKVVAKENKIDEIA